MKKTVERTEEKVDNQSKILSELSTEIKLIKRDQEFMWESISELKKNPRD